MTKSEKGVIRRNNEESIGVEGYYRNWRRNEHKLKCGQIRRERKVRATKIIRNLLDATFH